MCVLGGRAGVEDRQAKLAVLRNAATALDLVRETTKAVIREALAEPQLVIDLREC